MLFLKYGNYSHAVSEGGAVIRYTNEENEEGQIVSVVAEWEISGILQAGSLSELVTKMRALEAAYSLPDKELSWRTTTGTVAHILRLSEWDSIRPQVLAYPEPSGGELVTTRSYRINVKARRKPSSSNGADEIVEYTESIDIAGTGGPDVQYQPVMQGDWPEYQLTEKTIVTITQSGSAVGLTGHIEFPQPLYPDRERKKLRRRNRTGPRKRTPKAREFPSQWSYTFEFMGGLPNVPDPFYP